MGFGEGFVSRSGLEIGLAFDVLAHRSWPSKKLLDFTPCLSAPSRYLIFRTDGDDVCLANFGLRGDRQLVVAVLTVQHGFCLKLA